MKPIQIDWEELELACERNAVNVVSYLDRETGAVLVFYGESEDEQERHRQVKRNLTRYLEVAPVPPKDQYKWMEKFIATLTDDELRERVLVAIDGKGAFRRFKDLLVHYPGVRERWFAYRGLHLHAYINEWIVVHQIELAEPPPWGLEVVPPEDEPVPAAVVTAELGPAEVLRRQAKELVDKVPAVELELAIAFLTFLKDRQGGRLSRPPGH
jgi:hypothetical protein